MSNAQNYKQTGTGFTLIEVMIVIGLITILASFAFPGYNLLRSKNDLSTAQATIVNAINHAQIRSQAIYTDSTWSIRIQDHAATVFQGTDYATRDVDLDVVFSLPSQMSITGLSDIGFTKLTGFPETVGTISISTGTSTRTIVINEKGGMEY